MPDTERFGGSLDDNEFPDEKVGALVVNNDSLRKKNFKPPISKKSSGAKAHERQVRNSSGVKGRNRTSAIDRQDNLIEESFESHELSQSEHHDSRYQAPANVRPNKPGDGD